MNWVLILVAILYSGGQSMQMDTVEFKTKSDCYNAHEQFVEATSKTSATIYGVCVQKDYYGE